jgi:DNA-binding response OmpR family regulator
MKQTQYILVADNFKFTREIIKESLESKGYQVLTFSDGVQARKFWQDHNPDLTILNSDFSSNDGPFSPSEMAKMAKGRVSHVLYLVDAKGVASVPLPGTPIRIHNLVKPFIIRDLAKMVDGILRSHPSGYVPIFQGTLKEFTIWELLKKIEEQGLTGELKITRPSGQETGLKFRAGQIDGLANQAKYDEDDVINDIVQLEDGEFVVYQKLLAFNDIEPSNAGGIIDKYKHFVIPETVENKMDLLCSLLEEISKRLFDIVGRNQTVKTLLKCIKELRPKYPFLQLLNVDYSGEVALYNWKKELDMDTIKGFAELTFRFISQVNSLYLDENEAVALEQLVERMDAKLEEVNFYQIYQSLELQRDFAG